MKDDGMTRRNDEMMEWGNTICPRHETLYAPAPGRGHKKNRGQSKEIWRQTVTKDLKSRGLTNGDSTRWKSLVATPLFLHSPTVLVLTGSVVIQFSDETSPWNITSF